MTRRGVFLLVMFLCCTFAGFSQQRRQSVGLVLSGGGARGLAHLGVLRALEEAQIPVDYICGTSMGAIVGGLYAAGYSVEQMEEIFYSEEFQLWLTGKVEDKYVYYYKKREPSSRAFSLSFDVNDKFAFQIPTSIIDPIQMDYAFMEIFSGATYASKGDFDSLMIPFFCISSDIENNRESVRRSGELGLAIRASMTFPFVFSPIKLDGKIMFDGGMYNNFPSKHMLDIYHPDMIIGVKVAGNFPPPKEGNMRSYLENMLTTDSDYDVYCDNGVLIEPDLTGIGVMEFNKMKECDRLGYEAARSKIDEIREFLVDSVSGEELQKKRNAFNAKKPSSKVKMLSIQGVTGNQKYYISNSMKHGLTQNDYTTESMKKNYISLYTDPNIKDILPSLYYNDFFDAYVMNLDVRTKRYLNFGVGGHLSTNPTSFLYFGVDYNFLDRNAWLFMANTYIGRYYKSLYLGTRVDFSTSFPLYMELSATGNQWNYFRLHSGFFEYSRVNYLEQGDNNLQLRIGTAFDIKDRLYLSLGIGELNYNYFDNDYIISSDTSDLTRFDNYSVSIVREYNSMDDVQYPTKGNYQKLCIQYVGGIERFYPGSKLKSSYLTDINHQWLQFHAVNRTHIPIAKYYTLGIRADAFYSFQNLFSTYKASLLNAGVYQPTLETMTNYMPEYRASQYLGIGMENIFFVENSLGINLSARVGTYLYVPIRRIVAYSDNLPYYEDVFKKFYFIANTVLVLKTPLGPLSFTVSYHQRDNKSNNPWSVSLNFGYVIFNKRSVDK